MIALELLIVSLVGVVAGALINWAVSGMHLTPRRDNPWNARLPARWDDRLPLLGWLRWRRHAREFGRGFWLRPLVVEASCAVGLAALYWAEVHEAMLWPSNLPPPALGEARAMFGVHAALFVLLAAATLIDVDEKIIPDGITLPGTLLGFALAAAAPLARLPIAMWIQNQPSASPLLLTHPDPWFAWLDARYGLLLGLACFWAWCAAFLPRRLLLTRGWSTAGAILARRLRRDPVTPWIAGIAVVGAAGLWFVWQSGGASWRALLTALVGAAISGGLVWSMRIIGSWALGQEALGFGDVTLMGLIGAFLGWQPSAIVFFIAPLLGLFVGITRWVMRRDKELPYGPYLCLAALLVVVFWQDVWQRTEPIFGLGLWLLAVLGVCLLAIYPLLGIVRLILGEPPPNRRGT